MNIGSSIVNALTGSLSMIGDLANGVKDGIIRLFTDGSVVEGVYTPSGLSVVGVIMLTFAGISLAFGLCKLAFHLFQRKVG